MPDTTTSCCFADCDSTGPLYVVDSYRHVCNHVVWLGLVACSTHAHSENAPNASTCQLCGTCSHVYINVVAPI